MAVAPRDISRADEQLSLASPTISGVHVALLFTNYSPLFPAERDFNSQLSCPNNTQNILQLPMPSPSQFTMPMLTTTANLKHVINLKILRLTRLLLCKPIINGC